MTSGVRARVQVVLARAIDQHLAELTWFHKVGVCEDIVSGVESKADHVEGYALVQVDVRNNS
jgi:hypothetical protein